MRISVRTRAARPRTSISWVLAACLAASACGGKGGGGASDPPTPAHFVTAEFEAEGGLGQINAQYAYAEGATGAGVTVAVVDTGVDFTNPDLAPNKHLNSINIRTGDPINDFDGHGTAVAGIVAAAKNDVGMHGVAYDASILGIRADICDADPLCSAAFADDDIAAGIDYAIDNGAGVINLSLGGAAPNSALLETALERAATNGVIVVAATGNDGAFQPDNPAAFATDPRADASMIAVGAVWPDNSIASFSNRCGMAKDFCLVAPGVNIVTTDLGGGTIFFSGTSASTPHVSGAAAVLISAFPHLTAKQVVDILLTSAADLGAAGVDDVYGHGLLDLRAAMAPLGPASVPTSSSPGMAPASLDDTSIMLGAAFGDGFAQYAGLLGRVIMLDGYERAYFISLTPRISAAPRGILWDGIVAADAARTLDIPGPFGTRFGFVVREGASDTAAADANLVAGETAPVAESGLDGVMFAASLGERTSITLGAGLTARRLERVAPAANAGRGLFLYGDESLAPYAGLVGTGNGAGVSHRLSDATWVGFAWFDGEAGPSGTETRMWQARVSHRLGSGVMLGVGYASVEEGDGYLGTTSGGAFGDGVAATSQFATASLLVPLWGRTDFLASYTEAVADIDSAGAGLLSDWSEVRANAFAAGIVTSGAFADGDRLGLLAGQPLRVHDARATLTIPDSANADGSVNFTARRIDVVPTGREIDLQLAYERPVLSRFSLQGWALARLQPGHDRDAEPDYGVGLKIKGRF